MERFDLGDYVRIQIAGVSFDYHLEDLGRGVFRTQENSGLLPPAIRWMDRDCKKILVERPPQLIRIEFFNKKLHDLEDAHNAGIDLEPTVYQLPLPWTLWLVHFISSNSVRLMLWCRPAPLQSLNDQLYYLPLPNTGADGSTCLGAGGPWESWGTPDLTARIAQVINWFLEAGFNNDMGFNYKYLPNGMKHESFPSFLEVWEKASIEDVLSWDFSPGEIIISYGGSEGKTTMQDVVNTLTVSSNTSSIEFLRQLAFHA